MTKGKDEGGTNKHIRYDRTSSIAIQMIYIVAAVLWIILIYALGIFNYQMKWMHIILFIPLVIYAVGFLQTCKATRDIEDDMFSADFVSIGLLFITLFVQWTQKIEDNDTKHTLYVTLSAFTLIMFSIIDIWTTKRTLSYVKHVRSVFQTAGIVLLIYLLYFHFSNMIQDHQEASSKSVENMKITNIIPIAAGSTTTSS